MVGEDGTAGATRCPPLSQPTGRRPLGRLLAWTRRRRRRDLGPPAGEETMGVARTRRRLLAQPGGVPVDPRSPPSGPALGGDL